MVSIEQIKSKTKPPYMCPTCGEKLYFTPHFWIGMGYQPLEYACNGICENRHEIFWKNPNFIKDMTDLYGVEGLDDYLYEIGWSKGAPTNKQKKKSKFEKENPKLFSNDELIKQYKIK